VSVGGEETLYSALLSEKIETSYEIISYESTGIVRRHLLRSNIEALQEKQSLGRKKTSVDSTKSSYSGDADVVESGERKSSSVRKTKYFTSLTEELNNIRDEMGLDVVEESAPESSTKMSRFSLENLRFPASSFDLMSDDADAGKLEKCRTFTIATPWESAHARIIVPTAYPGPDASLVSFSFIREKETCALPSLPQFILQLNRSAMLRKMRGKCYIKSYLDGFLLSLPQHFSSAFVPDSGRTP
jgi:hypothetical protein